MLPHAGSRCQRGRCRHRRSLLLRKLLSLAGLVYSSTVRGARGMSLRPRRPQGAAWRRAPRPSGRPGCADVGLTWTSEAEGKAAGRAWPAARFATRRLSQHGAQDQGGGCSGCTALRTSVGGCPAGGLPNLQRLPLNKASFASLGDHQPVHHGFGRNPEHAEGEPAIPTPAAEGLTRGCQPASTRDFPGHADERRARWGRWGAGAKPLLLGRRRRRARQAAADAEQNRKSRRRAHRGSGRRLRAAPMAGIQPCHPRHRQSALG